MQWLAAATLLLGWVSGGAQAAWTLDNEASDLNFVSIKQEHIAENFAIERLSGGLSDEGELSLTLDLNSVRTQIDIRDQRLREKLFEVAKFPHATVRASVPETILQSLNQGALVQAELKGELDLHGVKQIVPMSISAFSDGQTLMVSSARPILLRAEGFALKAGIQALKALAGLQSISEVTPVHFTLIFRKP